VRVTVTVGLAAVVGVLLGLLGGGGSILMVPLLMYVGGMETRGAIATSLLVIGASSAVALLPHAVAGRVRWRVGAIFAAAGVVGAHLGGRVARIVPEALLLGGFGVMMVFTALALYRCRRCDDQPAEPLSGAAASKVRLLLQGFGVGALTGLVGVGGGFLIVPALTLFAGVPTRVAAGTSLMVISLNSLSGFTGHAAELEADPRLLLALVVACAIGSLGGSLLANRAPQRLLRRGFAVVVMAVAVFGFLGPTLIAQTPGVKKGAAMFGAMFGLFRDRKTSAIAHDLVAGGAALVDVRTPDEFAAGHLPGAINIPVDEIERRAGEIGPLSRPIVTYCRSGARSGRAKSALERMGFAQVVNLGPKSAW
jgi:uncharacterized membrane protein YfcA/rhodanese-related sulfurtransferase